MNTMRIVFLTCIREVNVASQKFLLCDLFILYGFFVRDVKLCNFISIRVEMFSWYYRNTDLLESQIEILALHI